MMHDTPSIRLLDSFLKIHFTKVYHKKYLGTQNYANKKISCYHCSNKCKPTERENKRKI